MPITQQRLLNTLIAGEAFRDKYYTLRENLHKICAHYYAGDMTHETALSAIAVELTAAPPYMPADTVLNEERSAYRYTHNRNEIEKRRMRRIRQEAGIIPRKDIRQIRHTPPMPPDQQPADNRVIQRVVEQNTAEDTAVDDWLNAPTDAANEYERVFGKKWKPEEQ